MKDTQELIRGLRKHLAHCSLFYEQDRDIVFYIGTCREDADNFQRFLDRDWEGKDKKRNAIKPLRFTEEGKPRKQGKTFYPVIAHLSEWNSDALYPLKQSFIEALAQAEADKIVPRRLETWPKPDLLVTLLHAIQPRRASSALIP